MRRTSGILVLVLVACGGHPATDAAKGVDAPVVEIPAPSGGLALDNGRKWAVSPHMMAPIQRMRQRLTDEDTTTWNTPDAPRALADSLFRDMDELVRLCDMKGPAHDMLHAWLMPHMTLLQRLETAPSADSARHVLTAMVRSNALFDRHFQ